MPSPLPSSFASAAAGNTQDSSRKDGSSGEWTRSRMNGATQTFRRPSLATNTSHNRDSNQATSASTPTPTTSAAYIPPHLNSNYQSRNGSTGDSRYSKEQLLNIYKSQREAGTLGKNVEELFVADWNPLEETPSVNGAWGKRDDHKDTPVGPEVCWDHEGQFEPLGLIDMNDDEKELFSTTVNSPLKPPPSSVSKDNAGGGAGGRKTSVSHSNAYNISSPSSGRPGTRRRETTDSAGNSMSPTTGGSRFFRDEPNTTTPPPSLLRRKTDFRDSSSNAKPDDRDKAKEGTGRENASEVSSPFSSLKRTSTNPLSAGLTGPTSPWPSATQSASFSPMGAFGSFSLGPTNTHTTSSTERRPGFGSIRGESRFKGLLSKDSSEDVDASGKEKSSQPSIEKLSENEGGSRSQSPWGEPVKTRTTRSETNPFGEEPRSGSAALGGSQELGTSSQGVDQLGFSAFGANSGVPGLRELLQTHDNSHDSSSQVHGLEPTSPTNTNPYQSPRGEKADVDSVETDGSEVQRTHVPGLSDLRDDSSTAPLSSIRRGGSGLDIAAGDRSQTSSAGPGRGFSGLGGLGGMSGLGGAGGWPSSGPIGTPTRERQAFSGFGDPIFGTMGEIQSPSLSTLGGGGFFGPQTSLSGTGSIGRASKMGSLFPPAMQEQMQGEQTRQDSGDRQPDTSNQVNPPSTTLSTQVPSTSAASGVQTPVATTGESQSAQTQTASNSISNNMPASQQRTMVMPDRMRWIYRDPQGNIQGPWSGLEMHDWFKAGFFTPDLLVKRLEDPDFEPLAQLVRRIGNSREPFLVPQIGIPYGPDPTPSGPWGSQPGTAQPPFANSFPTFGTTLTAEQQNALERRKQEEQYMMARQKEHFAQQQALMKQMQLQGGPHGMHPHQLQHHSSAHSLHSQPSYGTLTSPGGYQPSPIQGPIQPLQAMPNYFGQTTLPGLGPQMLGTDLMGSQNELPALLDRLNMNRPGPYAFDAQASFAARPQDLHSQQVAQMLQDRARLQQEQEQYDKAHADDVFDQQAREERLREFHALRAQDGELPTHPTTTAAQQDEQAKAPQEDETAQKKETETTSTTNEEQPLSLSQQVQQKAASAQKQQQQQQQQQQQGQQQQKQAQTDSGVPQPHPPAPSASPLPAPAAQRKQQNVADALAATSRSQNQTPVEAPTTSIAPWAKDTSEAPKGPSLKEIQEAEARSAAQREEMAAAARRAQLLAEQERIAKEQQAASSPGLPSTANWASQGSPATPGSTGSNVWSKSVAGGKGAAANQPAKKTLAQIQKEEEARKQRLAAQNAAQQANANTAAVSAGKRYADLASKAAAQPAPASNTSSGGGAWTTVGAGGKPKPPPAAPAGPRSTPATVSAPQAAKSKPAAAPARTVTTASNTPAANPNRATEELVKWAKMSLGRGLNSNINVDDFVQQLLLLPAETEIISDSVYANSQTLDGRRFAEEFIRRRKLADKGIVDPVSTTAFGGEPKNSSGGWSEVAKKGSNHAHREDDNSNAAFKVVAAKKKGKR